MFAFLSALVLRSCIHLGRRLAHVIQTHWEEKLACDLFDANLSGRLPYRTPRMISRVDVEGVALLIEDVGIDTESLQ